MMHDGVRSNKGSGELSKTKFMSSPGYPGHGDEGAGAGEDAGLKGMDSMSTTGPSWASMDPLVTCIAPGSIDVC